MLPEVYLDTVGSIRTYYRELEEKQLKNAVSSAEGYRKSNDVHAKRITEITNKFLDTGVFFLLSGWEYLPKTDRSRGEWYHTTMSKYCRNLAKSLKRPFIRMEGDYRLLLPATKRVDILTTPFVFTAVHTSYTWGIPTDAQHGVYEMKRYTSLREYRFHGDEGQRQRETWLEYIKSPECRKAMGLA